MASSDFDPVLFILDGQPVPLDIQANPFLYNSHGRSHALPAPRGTLIQVAQDDPTTLLGRRYPVVSAEQKTIGSGTSSYQITEFDFGAEEVVYEPMWATKETARAFGITLLAHDQSIRVAFDGGLISSDYTYGTFAGYQSPYIAAERRRQLLTVNATDLEYHAFPHLFCSHDTQPLVTSVARWRPLAREIALADLWVRPGDCLFIPPKQFRDSYVDMHGNRNSARACWGIDGKDALLTTTILGDDAVFSAPDTKPHYHEEKHPTVHAAPRG